jgi:hypothetical protein
MIEHFLIGMHLKLSEICGFVFIQFQGIQTACFRGDFLDLVSGQLFEMFEILTYVA